MSIPGWSPQRFHNVEYFHAERPLHLDAFVPGQVGPYPAAIIVHGGGWVAGDRRTNVEPLFDLLADAGFAWFSISYTLASNPLQFGAAVTDVEKAVDFVLANAERYRVDPHRVVLMGESAGGQLAAMAALRSRSSEVKGVVALYAPMDLEAAVDAGGYGNALAGLPVAPLLRTRMRQFSPIHHVYPGMPPFLLIHGRNDSVVRFSQSEAMCRAVRAAGGVCDLIAVRDGGHGIRRWHSANLTSYGGLMTAWLDRHVNGRIREAR